MKREVVVTGVGVVSAAGLSCGETWDTLKAGRDGLTPFTLLSTAKFSGVPSGQIAGDLASLSGLPRACRPDQIALIAARQALAESFPHRRPEELEKAGVLLGACVGDMAQSEVFIQHFVQAGAVETDWLKFHECGSAAETVAEALGLWGPCETISTACSSGSNAISLAADMIATGQTEVMLAGGIDSFSRLTLNGFGSLLLIDGEGCRPFDQKRKGISLGEGAAVLVLESEESARRRQAPILARLRGWANTCDAHHATAPAPNGDGIVRAIQSALGQSELKPDDIHYINAHGTATIENDRAESAALLQIFGESMPPVSSTKRFFGHTFAAAGAIEAVVCVLALKNQALLPNAGLTQQDPQCPVRLQQDFESSPISTVMSLSLGFGGNNNCLILTRGEA